MRFTLGVFLLIITSLAPAQQAAQKPAPSDPQKIAEIEELFSILKLDQMQQQTMSQIEQVAVGQIDKSVFDAIPNPANQEKLHAEAKAFQKQVFAFLADAMKFEKLKPELVKMYDETFSSEEVAAVLAFYKSPAGQAYIQKLPELTSKSVVLGTRIMQEAMPQMQKMMNDWLEDMKTKYAEPDAK